MQSLSYSRKCRRTVFFSFVAEGNQISEVYLAHIFLETFGILTTEIYSNFLHDTHSVRMDFFRLKSSTIWFKLVATVFFNESFSHLTTGRIAGAQKKDVVRSRVSHRVRDPVRGALRRYADFRRFNIGIATAAARFVLVGVHAGSHTALLRQQFSVR